MIKEVIFDCFGVLTQDGWSKLIQQYGNDSNRNQLSDLNKAADQGVISLDEFYKSVSEITKATKADIVQILVNSYHPEDAVFALVAQLKKGYKIGLISNISAPIEQYLPTAPLELFNEQTLSYQVGVAKPDLRIFELHLQKTGVKSDEAVFIDDREVNVEAARSVGLHGIWYKNLEQLENDLRQLGIDY